MLAAQAIATADSTDFGESLVGADSDRWAADATGSIPTKGRASLVRHDRLRANGSLLGHIFPDLARGGASAGSRAGRRLADAGGSVDRNSLEGISRPETLRVRGESAPARCGSGRSRLPRRDRAGAGGVRQAWELRARDELRTAVARSRRPAKGLHLLAPIYGWFTEGFDTADLKEAKALIDELD